MGTRQIDKEIKYIELNNRIPTQSKTTSNPQSTSPGAQQVHKEHRNRQQPPLSSLRLPKNLRQILLNPRNPNPRKQLITHLARRPDKPALALDAPD